MGWGRLRHDGRREGERGGGVRVGGLEVEGGGGGVKRERGGNGRGRGDEGGGGWGGGKCWKINKNSGWWDG